MKVKGWARIDTKATGELHNELMSQPNLYEYIKENTAFLRTAALWTC